MSTSLLFMSSKNEVEKFKWEMHYVIKVFCATYKKFLTAIDHIDYHPSQIQRNMTRTKRSVIYNAYGHYHSSTKILTPSEENFLECLHEGSIQNQPILTQ